MWAIGGGLREHFKEISDSRLDLSMCFWGCAHMYEMSFQVLLILSVRNIALAQLVPSRTCFFFMLKISVNSHK